MIQRFDQGNGIGSKEWATILLDCNTCTLGCAAQLSKSSKILHSGFKLALLQHFQASFMKLMKNQSVMIFLVTYEFWLYFYKLLETFIACDDDLQGMRKERGCVLLSTTRGLHF